MSVFQSLLNNDFDVARLSRVSDGQGGFSAVYSEVTTVTGRMRPTSATERTVADSEEAQISHVFYTEAGEDILRGDMISLGDFSAEVLDIREPSHADEHWEIDCLERQYEGDTLEVGS